VELDRRTARRSDYPLRRSGVCRRSDYATVGTISLVNGGVAPTTVTVTVQVNGVTLPVPSYVATIVNGARAVIPILAETTPGETPVGVTSFIEIFVIGDTISVEPDGSSLGLQEVSVATG